MQNAKRSDDVPTRLEHIDDHFAFALYTAVCRSLFERHKLLFSALLATRLLASKQLLTGDRLGFLLTGGVGIKEVAVSGAKPCVPCE